MTNVFKGSSKQNAGFSTTLPVKLPKKIEHVAKSPMEVMTVPGTLLLTANLIFSLDIMKTKRKLYKAVNTTPVIIIKKARIFTDNTCETRAIWCFEKNVERKNNPVEEIKNALNNELNKGISFEPPNNLRLSCAPNLFMSIAPAVINNPALNNA